MEWLSSTILPRVWGKEWDSNPHTALTGKFTKPSPSATLSKSLPFRSLSGPVEQALTLLKSNINIIARRAGDCNSVQKTILPLFSVVYR